MGISSSFKRAIRNPGSFLESVADNIVPIAVAAGIGFLSGGIVGAAVLAGSTALGIYGAGLEGEEQNRGTASPGTRQTTVASAVPAEWCFGRVRTGGVLAYMEEENVRHYGFRRSGSSPELFDKALHMVFAISEGPIDGVSSILFNGEEVWSSSRGYRGVHGNFIWRKRSENGNWVANERLLTVDVSKKGGASNRDALNIPGPWDNDCKLQGVAYVYLRLLSTVDLRYKPRNQPRSNDYSGFYKRIPKVEFIVRGKWLSVPYDTQNPQGINFPITPGGERYRLLPDQFTDNAAAVRYWLETNRWGRDPADIDLEDYYNAFNTCRQEITGISNIFHNPSNRPHGGGGKYQINGIVRSTDKKEQIIKDLDFCWQGYAVEQDGKLHFRPGALKPPVATITRDDIIENVSVFPAPALQDRFNTATMRLSQDMTKTYTESVLDERQDPVQFARDGARLVKDFGNRAFTIHPQVGLYLMDTMLKRNRANARYTYRLTPRDDFSLMDIKPADYVVVNDPLNFLDDILCFVLETRVEEDWSITLSLAEAARDAFSATALGFGDPASERQLTDPVVIRPAMPVAATTQGVEVVQDGAIRSRVTVSWGGQAAGEQAEVILSGPNDYVSIQLTDEVFAEFDVPEPGDYTAEVTLIDAQGQRGDPATASLTVSWDQIVPPTPVLTLGEVIGSNIRFTFAPVDSRDVAGVEIRYYRVEVDDPEPGPLTDWSTAPRLQVSSIVPSVAGSGLFTTALAPGIGQYRFFVRFVNRQGLQSDTTDVGVYIVLFAGATGQSFHAEPLWTGQFTNLGLIPQGDGEVVVGNPTHDIIRRRLDGSQGWPFGGPGFSTTTGTWRGELTDLGGAHPLEARVVFEGFTPAGSTADADAVLATAVGKLSYKLRAADTETLTAALPVGSWMRVPQCRFVRPVLELPPAFDEVGISSFRIDVRRTA